MEQDRQKMIYESFAQFYDHIYGEIDIPIEEQSSYQFVKWVLKNYEISMSDKILDIGSGTGRILLPLAKEGYKISGLEPFEKMRKISEMKAKKKNISVHLDEGSFGSLNAKDEYDLILSINGSFAYVMDIVDAIKSFENIKTALKTGGIFVIDIMNFYGIIGNYKYPELTEIEIEGMKGQYILKLDKDIDRSVWIHDMNLYLETNEGIKHFEDYHELALISPRELKLLAYYNDLELINYFNSYSQPLEEDSEGTRCIMIFQNQTTN